MFCGADLPETFILQGGKKLPTSWIHKFPQFQSFSDRMGSSHHTVTMPWLGNVHKIPLGLVFPVNQP